MAGQYLENIFLAPLGPHPPRTLLHKPQEKVPIGGCEWSRGLQPGTVPIRARIEHTMARPGACQIRVKPFESCSSHNEGCFALLFTEFVWGGSRVRNLFFTLVRIRKVFVQLVVHPNSFGEGVVCPLVHPSSCGEGLALCPTDTRHPCATQESCIPATRLM